jgi:phosphatidate cytidylyltransferase
MGMGQLVKRGISGFIYVVIVLVAIFYLPHGIVFLALFLGTAAILEWLQLEGRVNVSRQTALMLGIFVLLLYRFSGSSILPDNNIEHSELLMAILIMTLVLGETFSPKQPSIAALFKMIFGLAYIALPLGILTQISTFNDKQEPWLLAGVFILTWSSDTFAYFSGKYFGKRKLAPVISPNKTWEGLMGGILATLIIAALAGYQLNIMPIWAWLGLALVVIVFGTVGDLFESAVKRHYKIKDSGKFMPGHGGILDRIDSLLFAAPMTYFYLKVIESYY